MLKNMYIKRMIGWIKNAISDLYYIMLFLYYLTIFALTYFLALLTSIPMMRVYSIPIIARVVKANIWVFDCAFKHVDV